MKQPKGQVILYFPSNSAPRMASHQMSPDLVTLDDFLKDIKKPVEERKYFTKPFRFPAYLPDD